MNRFLTYLLFAVTLGLAGCQSNEPDLIAESGESKQKGQSGLFDEIVARANHYYAMLPGKTRAAAPQVSGITPINPGTTRSENGDEAPLYYIVNYENEEGFVIVGGNESADPMVAVSDEGNFSLADTIDNKSIASFIKGLEIPTAAIDTLKPFPNLPANVSVDPVLDAKVRKWGQGKPFNSQIPYFHSVTGERLLVGCGVLASAMIMSYHQHPESHNGHIFNWKYMTTDYNNSDLAFLLYDLGKPENLNSCYNNGGTSINPDNFKRAFNNYNYSFPTSTIDLADFSLSSKMVVMAQLPLLVYGYGNVNNNSVGHAWVIDGLLHVQEVMGLEQTVYESFYFHCVWGWYGKGNGYYKIDKVNRIGGERYSKGKGDGMYPGYSDSDTNPEWSFNGLKGIRPKPSLVVGF